MASNKLSLDIIVVDSHDPRILAIADISTYPKGFVIISPTLLITPPSFQSSSHIVSTNNINIYTTNSLTITCSDEWGGIGILPDGIWKLKYSVSPPHENFIEKTFMRVDNILIKMDTAFMQTDMTECDLSVKEKDKKTLDDIQTFIYGSVAAGNNCNEILAMKLYRTADRMLDDFLNYRKAC